jgi:hypothetical protein
LKKFWNRKTKGLMIMVRQTMSFNVIKENK